jgi:hypothetical protein
MQDRRSSPRQRTFIGARVEFADTSTLDGIVTNMTRSGAKLRCSNHVMLPDVVTLHVKKTHERHTARVVWRDENAIGLSIIGVSRAEQLAAMGIPTIPSSRT